MKKVLNFFSRPEEEQKPARTARTTYVSREPTLNPQPAMHPRNVSPSAEKTAGPGKSPAPRAETDQIPIDYAGIVEYFQKKIRERKSPYNGLTAAADGLKEFIPDETSRLKAVLAICGDKWPLDALSLAISTHISDIELARTKARQSTHARTTERTAEFRQQAAHLKEQNEKIKSEISALNDSILKLEANLNANRSALASLDEQIQLAESNAGAVSFVDQAAENIKNDLLAKKVILGLP